MRKNQPDQEKKAMGKSVTRREFTKLAAGAGLASTAVLAGRASAETVSPNEKIRVALIGCGAMGTSLLNHFLKVREVEPAVICDVDSWKLKMAIELVEQIRGAKKSVDVTKDFREVIDRKDVDVVINATPDHWHALPTIMACQAGKDVYVEKPLSLTIEEGRVMVNAARKHNRVVQMGTQQRSADHYRQCVDIVKSGGIGKVRMVRCWAYLNWVYRFEAMEDEPVPANVDYEMWLGPAPKRPFNRNRFHFSFRWFWDYAGGLMTDWGAHMLDIANLGMNVQAPKSAISVGGKFGFPDDVRQTPDTQQAVLVYDGFSVIWEHAIGIGIGPWQREHGVAFQGSDGVLVVDRLGWEIAAETEPSEGGSRFKMTPVPRQKGSVSCEFLHVKNFLDCVKSREKPVSDVEIAHQSMKACHLSNIAYRTGRKVDWDDEKEEIVGDAEAQEMVRAHYRAPWELPKV